MSGKRVAVSVSTETDDRMVVAIDGVEYELVDAEDLELKDALWLAKAGLQIQQAAGGDYSDDDIERLSGVLDRMVHAVLPSVPADVFAKLKSRHKLAIAGAFTEAAAPSGGATRRPGTEPSPESSASTADPEPSGSDVPPPASAAISS